MVVAIQEDLHHIRAALKGKGHTVVDLASYPYPVDAFIYEGRGGLTLSHVSRNHMPTMESGNRANFGVLVINSCGKSLFEIEEILKNRCYSSLFS